jgi:hypothetical protein
LNEFRFFWRTGAVTPVEGVFFLGDMVTCSAMLGSRNEKSPVSVRVESQTNRTIGATGKGGQRVPLYFMVTLAIVSMVPTTPFVT